MEASLQDNKVATAEFLSGGGEMGQLIREKDWNKTPLGDPKDWPQSLRTMVSVMLDNPFGMYIAWGSEYTQLYNDGYRPILGLIKHPQALGISTRETFSEIWHIIESMFDGVMQGTAVGYPDLMLPLNRNGFVEECYFDFSYSPIRKEDGEIGGVLVTVIETTDKKKAQAELLENTNQLKFAMDAAELGTWDYNPSTNKFTANERLRQWFGLSASEEIELHHATDAIAGKDRDRIILAIKKTLDHSSGGVYEEEYSIINPVTNKETIVHGRGRAWFNDEKIAYRFNGILQEVTENVLARKKIEESEEQLRIAIEGGEFGTFDFTPKANQLIWSGKTKELFGLPPDAHVDYETYIAAIHPEDRDTSRAIAQQQAHLKDGGLYEVEYRTIGITDGKLRWLRSKGKATYNDEGKAIRYTGVIQDITKQKEAAELLLQSNKRFRDTVKQAPVGICILRGAQYIVETANDAYLQLVDRKESEFVGLGLFVSLPEAEGSVHTLLDNVLKTGVPYHGNEVAIPVNRYGRQDLCYFDFLYHPLKEEDGEISGVIAIVTEVTEKVEARKTIEERKRLYETITQNTPDLIYVFDLNYRFSYANEALLQMWGRSWEDAVGKGMLEIGYEPWHAEMHEREIDQVIATKKTVRGEVSFPHATLGTRFYDYIFAPIIDRDGKVTAITGTTRDITQQVDARKQIEESEQRFQAAIQAVQGILWTNNGKGEMEGVQKGWALLTGQTYEEYQGYGWVNAVHPEDAQPTVDAWNEAVRELKTFIFEHRVKTKDGQWRDFSVRAIPLANTDGTLRQWVGVHTDITDSKQAAKALRANEEKLTIVIEASELGTWEVDIKTGTVAGSPRFREIIGYLQKTSLTVEDTLYQVHPDYRQVKEQAFKKAYETGLFYFTGPIIRDDHSIRWVESKGKVFYDEQKNPVKIIGTTADITDEKRKAQILSESEQKFRLLADSMPQHIWTSGPDGILNYFNKSVFDYSGLTSEQIDKDGWLQIVHPDDRDENIKQWIDSVTTGKDFLFEHRFRRYDGVYRWQLSRAIPQRDPSGKIQMWVGTSTDIDDKKSVEVQLDKLVKERTVQLERSNEDLQQFAHVASHDLKEPVRKIMTFCNRLIDEFDEDIPVRGKAYIEKIERASKRMTAMIEGVLTYSSVNAMDQTIEPVDLNDTITNIISDLEVIIQEKGANISMENLPTIEGAAVLLYQLFYNLVNNSLKFSKTGEAPVIAISSSFTTDNGNAMACITVTDNGIGFQNESSEKIFNTFARLNSKDKYEGTGLGLALCKKIVERHNGSITAKGEQDKGATFTILLPLKQHTQSI